jgi:hypothetical protein
MLACSEESKKGNSPPLGEGRLIWSWNWSGRGVR